MLQHFTWQQFLITALILTIIWYAGVLLIFYREEINELLNGKRGPTAPAEPLPHVWADEYDDEPFPDEENDLLGKPALPEGMSELSMAQFGFAPKVSATVDEEDRDTKLGIVPDVLEELKSIFHILQTENGGKKDFISLFSLVSAKYPKIKGTANQHALNDYIRENVLFSISDEELDQLWD